MRNLPHVPYVNDKVLMANFLQNKCYRDIGLVVDSIAFDLAYQTDDQSKFAGLQYWGQGLSTVRDQRVEVRNAFGYAQNLLTNVVVNSNSWDIDANVPYQTANVQVFNAPNPGSSALVLDLCNVFLDVYDSGTYEVTNKIVPNTFPPSTNITRQRTANLLQSNKSFIRSEILEFFTTEYPYAAYLPDKTIGEEIDDLVDNITFDILHTGNKQTISQAIRLYDYRDGRSQVSRIELQTPQTIGAWTFMKDIIDDILLREPLANVYQTGVSQDLSVTGNVSYSEITYVRNRLDNIINIIQNGPSYQNTESSIENIGLTYSTDANVINATKIILANREFLQAEILEYVNQNWADLSNGTRNFYTVNESTEISPGVYNVVFDEKIFFVDKPLANTRVSFHQGSYLSASSHTFEYVGSGTQLLNGINIFGQVNSLPSCLPSEGGIPIQETEVIESRGGGVYYTSTDHKGDFRIGNELLINRATGTINGRTFNKSLFAVMTPYILALQ
jgi:hypothetical protein